MDDWFGLVSSLEGVREVLKALDKRDLYPYDRPNLGASEEMIVAVEENLGRAIAPQLRQLWQVANGWKSFRQGVDLLGTEDYRGSFDLQKANKSISFLEEFGVLADLGIDVKDIYPIAVDAYQGDVFVMGHYGSRFSGRIFWFANGDIIEEYDSFKELFLFVKMLHEKDIQKFTKGLDDKNSCL